MIDFASIRGDTIEAKRAFFEQLVCHLAKLECVGTNFRRVCGSGGDGGVEALCVLPTGRKIGYQAKFHLERQGIDWFKLDNSVDTALSRHPELERYVIAFPCDFTGRRAARNGTTEGTWGTWDAHVTRWNAIAASRNLTVDFVPWTAFELEASLFRPEAQHLIRFFFERLVLSNKWIADQFQRTKHDLQARFSPADHVPTEALNAYDVMLHRHNVRSQLQRLFTAAESSDPRSARALIQDHCVSEMSIQVTEQILHTFVSLREALDPAHVRAWPVARWEAFWYLVTRRLLATGAALSAQIPIVNTFDSEAMHTRINNALKLYDLVIPRVFAGDWAPLLPIEASRAVIFVGRAGAGKSHLLAWGTEVALSDGAPVIHLLGQHIVDDDPRISILKRLELSTWSFAETIAALDLAAEAAGTRGMLVIDALNEGRGLDVWRNHLSSVISEVVKYERLILVLSCREEYVDYIVPRDLIVDPEFHLDAFRKGVDEDKPTGQLFRIRVSGFNTLQERELALRQFMDAKGIVRPTAPVLDAEFFNPLFMVSVCNAMAKAGMTVFPRGLHGARDLFQFVLATKAKALGTRYDGTPRLYRALIAALDGLAAVMTEKRQDCVSVDEALALLGRAFRVMPLQDQSWLEILEGSDILRRDLDTGVGRSTQWAEAREVVRFSFQRLQDHLIAEHMLAVFVNGDIEGAFDTTSFLGFLIHQAGEEGRFAGEPKRDWLGVLGALWAGIAERYGKELIDLASISCDVAVANVRWRYEGVFRVSLRERQPSAFTARTKELLDVFWADGSQEKIAILLSTACIPDHAWNADFLVDWLRSRDEVNRERALSSEVIYNASDAMERALEITAWAMHADIGFADPEVVRLVAIVLTVLLGVSNVIITQRAAIAITRVLKSSPSIVVELEKLFNGFDKPNFGELLRATMQQNRIPRT